MTKAHRMAILTYLFKEGVIVAKKDYNLAKHPDVEEASNLEVIKLMTSLTSKDLVSCRFSWKHYYWFLNDEGIAWLREYLHQQKGVQLRQHSAKALQLLSTALQVEVVLHCHRHWLNALWFLRRSATSSLRHGVSLQGASSLPTQWT